MSQARPQPSRVLHVAGEAVPWIKTGGLADVVGALPIAQRALGVDARVLIPAYPTVVRRVAEDPGLTVRAVSAPFGPAFGAARVRLFEIVRAGNPPPSGNIVPTYLLDAPWLYDHPGGPYEQPSGGEWPDSPMRFGLLGWVAAQVAAGGLLEGWKPRLLHLHDWHAALAPVYLQQRPGPQVPSLLTLHNVGFLGAFAAHWMGPLGLPWHRFHWEDLEFYGQLSFLKGGALASARLSTVSPTYAREIVSSPGGNGLEGVYRKRESELSGILNGIDLDAWNPKTDPLIEQTYDREQVREGKARNRRALMAQLGLRDDAGSGPLLGVVSRISAQKGIDLIVDAVRMRLQQPFRLVVLGSGDAGLLQALARLRDAHPDRISLQTGFDESLAHRIYAASDALLVPSRFEPCGLSQMYAHRYGTVPIVRRTGGLADTVHEDARDPGSDDGFVFDRIDAADLADAMSRMFDAYRSDERWQRLMQQGMRHVRGWDGPARQYLDVYRDMLA